MDRRVKTAKRDKNGKITALCNAGESWSPRRTADVIKDISSSKKSYYVKELEKRSYVRVVGGSSLQTTTDASSGNNLDRLPEG